MIRQYRSEDSESCSLLIRECLAADPSICPSLRQKLCHAETPESIEERSKLFYVVVYELENQIVGTAGLDMNEIRLLCVAPGRQRSGIGRALFEHLRKMVPNVLFPDIFVYSSLPALNFYRSLGFQEKGPVSFTISGENLNAVFMTLPIRENSG
jgi:N-acetylglutamate synthase-like GNAT family acetyltransferase